MKIIKLEARNIKNLKAIEITPTGDGVILTGKNGAGKSAIIDAIFSTLTGERIKDVIRHGEERADVIVEMNGFTVKKTWTEKGETIQVYTTNREGQKIKYSSPQTFLDEKIGELSFDPMAFKNMRPIDRIDLLKKIAGLDFTGIEKEKFNVYEDRAILNSKIKESLALLKNTEAPDPATPDEEITFKEVLIKVNDLRLKQRVYKDAVDKKERAEMALQQNAEDIQELQNNIRAIEERIKAIANESEEIRVSEEYNAELPPVVSDDDVREAEIELEEIEKKNVDIRAAKRYRQAIKDADKLKKDADALTERLRRLDQDKATQVANAKLPIPDLSLSDEDVMYKGFRFDRLSTGQQIRVSTAIGMALNPELKVIFIREGSLLDRENLIDIIEQAKDKDYQIWVEMCDESGQVGFFIEAGEITAIEGKKVDNKED